MPVSLPSHDLLVRVRTVVSIILGLSVWRLLHGMAGLARCLKKEHLWWPHLCQAAHIRVFITLFC
jgi:hypothetical protein